MAFWRFTILSVAGVMVAACASAPAKVSIEDAAAVEPQPRSEVDRILDDATLEQQERAVLFRRRFAQAKALWKAQRLEEALEATEHALLLQPGNEEAKAFRDELRHDLGYRDGSVRILAAEEAARYAALVEEERLSVERLIARAARHKQSGNWDQARRDYEAALFVLRTSRFRENDAYRALLHETIQRASGLADERASAEKARREGEDR